MLWNMGFFLQILVVLLALYLPESKEWWYFWIRSTILLSLQELLSISKCWNYISTRLAVQTLLKQVPTTVIYFHYLFRSQGFMKVVFEQLHVLHFSVFTFLKPWWGMSWSLYLIALFNNRSHTFVPVLSRDIYFSTVFSHQWWLYFVAKLLVFPVTCLFTIFVTFLLISCCCSRGFDDASCIGSRSWLTWSFSKYCSWNSCKLFFLRVMTPAQLPHAFKRISVSIIPSKHFYCWFMSF